MPPDRSKPPSSLPSDITSTSTSSAGTFPTATIRTTLVSAAVPQAPHPTLPSLPPELLDRIVTHLPLARHPANLAQTCRALHAYVVTGGWRVFASERFPEWKASQLSHSSIDGASAQSKPPWAGVVRALTTAGRNADRRGLRAGEVRPGRRGRTALIGVEDDDEGKGEKENGTMNGVTNGTMNSTTNSLTNGTTNGSMNESANSLTNGTAHTAAYTLPVHRREATPSSTNVSSRAPSIERRTLVRPLRVQPWQPPRGQTMGFVPCISSTSTPSYSSAGLTERDVLAIGAGAEVLLRVRDTDASRCAQRWVTYRPSGAVEGRDDVTCVETLSSSKEEGEESEHVLVGTAAGQLDVLSLRTGQDWSEPYEVVHSSLATSGRGVRDTALLRDKGLLSTVLGQDTLALYDLGCSTTPTSSTQSVEPLSTVDVTTSSSKRTQAWCTTWLADSIVGVTLSGVREPIRLHTLRPEGLTEQATTRIAIHPTESRTVYPIEPLHGTGGRVFASGGYDGVVRVHDVRCPGHRAQLATRDMAEYGTIYSLLSRPGHHLLAGTAQFDLLSVMDLRTQGFMRVPLSHVEDDGLTTMSPQSASEGEDVSGFDASPIGAYEYGGRRGSYYLYLRDRGTRFEGPVYTLSSPSAYSPFIYAGLENSVVQICLDGAADVRPDPVVRMAMDASAADWVSETPRPRQKRGRKKEPEAVWELNLKAVDHGSLVVQQQRSAAEARSRGPTINDLDERW
ncbi:hypothetical protein K461DRAFT_118090 [Myriangium duriaei CBS 260.36]|uniref:F-box domain-containing protein n=1 Tax=Myriangium duriaei CBS 260.36 TaxID=1168546 RepID=A0A9P4J349_9PEZI|nr:hypothetical protein K461DRAFT_118090 [Myriangium duriaei CBS 260.36]